MTSPTTSPTTSPKRPPGTAASRELPPPPSSSIGGAHSEPRRPPPTTTPKPLGEHTTQSPAETPSPIDFQPRPQPKETPMTSTPQPAGCGTCPKCELSKAECAHIVESYGYEADAHCWRDVVAQVVAARLEPVEAERDDLAEAEARWEAKTNAAEAEVVRLTAEVVRLARDTSLDRLAAEMSRAEKAEALVEAVRESATHPHMGPNDTDASMLRAAAKRLRGGFEPGGSHTKQTVANVITAVADLIDGGAS